jgi:hypothetical protein
VQNDPHPFHRRSNFLKHLEPFASHLGLKICETRDIASWTREVLDKAATDRVRNLQEHDWQATSCVANRLEREVSLRKDKIRL